MVSTMLVNRSVGDPRRIVTVLVPIGIRTSVADARRIVLEAASDAEEARGLAVSVRVSDVGEKVVWLTVVAYAPPRRGRRPDRELDPREDARRARRGRAPPRRLAPHSISMLSPGARTRTSTSGTSSAAAAANSPPGAAGTRVTLAGRDGSASTSPSGSGSRSRGRISRERLRRAAAGRGGRRSRASAPTPRSGPARRRVTRAPTSPSKRSVSPAK